MAELIRIEHGSWRDRLIYACDTCGKEVWYWRRTKKAICAECSIERNRQYMRNRAANHDKEIWNAAIDFFAGMLEARIEDGRRVDEKLAYIDHADIDELSEIAKKE